MVPLPGSLWGWQGMVVALLAAVLAGYFLGRRSVRAAAFEEGFRYAPLALRREALVRGRCPLCASPSPDGSARASGNTPLDGGEGVV